MPVELRPLDGWSIAHGIVGAVMASAKLPRPVAYTIIIATELIEFVFRQLRIFPVLFQEDPSNVLADILISLGSYELTRLVVRPG